MHKIAFQLGNFTIYWYGVLVALGLLAGLWTAGRRAPLSGIRGETVIDLGPWLILGTIVGARGLYVLSYWREDFARQPFWQIFNIRGLPASFTFASKSCRSGKSPTSSRPASRSVIPLAGSAV